MPGTSAKAECVSRTHHRRPKEVAKRPGIPGATAVISMAIGCVDFALDRRSA
ncbi:hypothetical protein MYA_4753 [Burkholderia sp. KJ006]|nr:hypothetical protein MYA_4753 [Burkholderia sp. KJ006]